MGVRQIIVSRKPVRYQSVKAWIKKKIRKNYTRLRKARMTVRDGASISDIFSVFKGGFTADETEVVGY